MILELLAAALLMGGDCDNNHDSGFNSRPRRSSDFDFEEKIFKIIISVVVFLLSYKIVKR